MPKKYETIDPEQEFEAEIGTITDKPDEYVMQIIADINGNEHKFQHVLKKGLVGENILLPGSELGQFMETYGDMPEPKMGIKIRFSKRGNPYIVGVFSKQKN